MINFDKLVATSTDVFDNRVKKHLTNYVDNELRDAGLPTFTDINNLRKDTLEKVLSNHDFITGGGFGGGGIAEITADPINNSLHLGLATKANVSSDAKNNPNNSVDVKAKNLPTDILRYPVSSAEERVPYMKITGFKYRYDSDDTVGNKSTSNSMIKTGKNAGEITASIRLPLPGNLASGLSQQYEDYNSVFSKLVRAYNGSGVFDGDGVEAAGLLVNKLKAATGGVDGEVWKDAAWAGGMAGLFSAAMQEGAGSVAANSIDEAFKYVRVNAGIAVNPMAQASYVGSNIRTHSFEFNMIPRSARESLECKKIIELLQYCSMGEKNPNFFGLLLNYPSVWNVSFHNFDDKPINGMLEIPDSVLTEVNVTYSPTRAGFTVNRDNDPFGYVLLLTFKESQNLVRDDLSYIRQGGTLFADMHPVVPEGSGIIYDNVVVRDQDKDALSIATGGGLSSKDAIARSGDLDTSTVDNDDKSAFPQNPAYEKGRAAGEAVREKGTAAANVITAAGAVIVVGAADDIKDATNAVTAAGTVVAASTVGTATKVAKNAEVGTKIIKEKTKNDIKTSANKVTAAIITQVGTVYGKYKKLTEGIF